MVDAETLARLSASRWFMPAMAMAHEGGGFRVAALLHRLGTSRSMVRRVVEQLVAYGWIASNPGHGHPLRPDYVLRGEGAAIAAWCAEVMAARRRLGLEPGDLGRWSLPVLRSVAPGWRRFSQLEEALDPITPRALSTTLKGLIGQRLVTRQLQESFPPTAIYGVTGRGSLLAEALA